ncbi:MAG: response regulator [Chloroflexi bacterium]|nr:MAG: response regulator [Chloroflexota bacterium]
MQRPAQQDQAERDVREEPPAQAQIQDKADERKRVRADGYAEEHEGRGGAGHGCAPSVVECATPPSGAEPLLLLGAMARPRILLADDDPRVLQVVSRYLDLEGYEMATVADGEAAVIMMPGIDGIEACRRIRANASTAATPVLMFSALSEEAEAAKAAGADGLLPKPFNLPTLAEAVKTFFAEHGASAPAEPA